MTPLQVSVCLLISSFRQKWPPDEDEYDAMFHAHKVLKPSMEIEQAINELVPFAIKQTQVKLYEHVAKRLELLEKELSL